MRRVNLSSASQPASRAPISRLYNAAVSASSYMASRRFCRRYSARMSLARDEPDELGAPTHLAQFQHMSRRAQDLPRKRNGIRHLARDPEGSRSAFQRGASGR